MADYGDYNLSAVVRMKFHTTAFATGAPTTLAGTPAVKVYKTNSTTESTAGITLTVDFDGVTGLHHVDIDTSADGTFYAAGCDFQAVITAGTVGGVSIVGAVVGTFSIKNRAALRPATAGRELVVDAAGLGDANMVKMGPTGSGTAQTARDIGLSVLLSAGSGTGQLDFTSGVVKANATQWLGGTIPAVNVTGVPLVDVKYLLGTAWLTPGTAGTPDVNVKLINAVATTSVTTINANFGTTQPWNFTSTAANALGKVDVRDFGGTAGTFASGIPSVNVSAVNSLSTGNVSTINNFWGTTENIIFSNSGYVDSNARQWAGSAVGAVNVSGYPVVDIGYASGVAIQAAYGYLLNPEVLNVTTIATLASQTSFTLTAGSANDSAYKGGVAVIQHTGTGVQKAVGVVSAYTGSSKTVTLLNDPAVFTMAAGDIVSILADRSLKATVDNRTLDVSTTGEGGLDFDNIKDATGAHTLTNITVPVVTTVATATNLTNAPTSGDFTATMKSSITTAATSSTPAVTVSDKTGFALTSGERDSIAAALLDLANGIETSLTMRNALKGMVATLFGKMDGLAGTTVHARNPADTKNRVTATVDTSGNRTAVTTDFT